MDDFMTTDIDDILMYEQPLSTGAMAKYKYTKRLETMFTGESRFEEAYEMFMRDGAHIYVPRAVCPMGEKDLRVTGFPCGFKSKVKPRNQQQIDILTKAKEGLDREKSFIIQAGTGSGKTVMSLDLIAHVNRPTLVVVPKEDLLDYWLEESHKFLDIPKNRVGHIKQDTCDYRGKWLVVGMLHSLAKKDRYPSDMYSYFGMIVYDEAHRLAAETFNKVNHYFPAKIKLGLSATPERSDGKETLIMAHIGPIAIISDSAPLGFKVIQYQSKWECPKEKRKLKDGREVFAPIKHTAGRCGHVLNMICGHKKTNRVIADFIEKAYNKERTVIVFSDRVEHLETLYDLTNIKDNDKAFYISSRVVDGKVKTMTKKDRDKAKGKRVIFATYGMMKEGTDIPWADTCVFATPRSDVKQAVGRIRREHPDKREPVVFDVLHESSPVFRGYRKSRNFFYEHEGASIQVLGYKKK